MYKKTQPVKLMLTGYALYRFLLFIPVIIRFPLRVRVFHESHFLSSRNADELRLRKAVWHLQSLSDEFIIKKKQGTCQGSRRHLSINFSWILLFPPQGG